MEEVLYPLPTILPSFIEVLPTNTLDLEVPLVSSYVAAGFPSPADDYMVEAMNLQRMLIHNPASTYLVRVQGNSMEDARLYDGDVLVVDRSLKPGEGHIIIGIVNGEFTVKRLVYQEGKRYLQPANDQYLPLELTEGMDFQPWGVVVWSLHKVQRS
ncbi:LexA family protein [Pontibacter chitinilyticus]|uniref:LexA family protein n=1 Tax=Pontibacter chitinilyticus TaxID=2674989 RepID=UPI00321A331E